MSARRFSILDQPSSTEHATCSSKRRFHKKQHAKEAVSRAARNGLTLYPYECPSCKVWHLSHIDPATERERRRG